MEKVFKDDGQDLIDEITRLRKHVLQLQNTIKKLQNPYAVKNIGKQRDFDFAKHCVRHIALKILYLGWDYDGLAAQEDTNRTIEAAIFDALYKTKLILSRQTSNYHRCGRTDKGVSAFSQVISIDLRTNLKHGPGIKKICINSEVNNLKNDDLIKNIKFTSGNYASGILKNDVIKYNTNCFIDKTIEPEICYMEADGDKAIKDSFNYVNSTMHNIATHNSSDLDSNILVTSSNNINNESNADLIYENQLLNNNKDDEGSKFFGEIQVNDNMNKGFLIEEQCLNDAEVPYVRMLNKVLPDDIRIIAWAPVDDNFSARFNCVQRTYKYYLPASDLNIELMQKAGNYLIGEHDFRNICKMDVNNGVINYKRKIISVQLSISNNNNNVEKDSYDIIEVSVVGLAFLWHQIRCIISLLIIVGKKLESPEIVLDLLDIDKNPRKPQYSMAADYPLVLFDCQYENVNWIYKNEDVQDVIKTLQSKWTQFAIRTRIIKNMLENLEDRIESPLEYQINSLLPSLGQKNYKPLNKREKCESLEDRITMVNKKRKTHAKTAYF